MANAISHPRRCPVLQNPREHLHGAGNMTRASKTLHLQVLGHLGDGPHELFAVLRDLQGSEVLHTLQKGLRA